jgi:hypothetical protein
MNKDYDEVILYSKDGSQTVIFVLDDDSISQAIVDECHEHGWDHRDVTSFKIRT